MLGTHVLSDLEIDTLQIPTALSWGATTFQHILQSPTSDLRLLKQRQLALFALRHKEAAEVCDGVRKALQTVRTGTEVVDELEKPMDPRIQESIEQIYWNPASFGAFLNSYTFVVAFLVFWKTLVIPAIAVLVPLLAIVVPFFLIRFLHGVDLSASVYMTQLRTILLKQITIPDVLRAKHEGDVLGKVLESGFLVLTGATYVSSIWSQVTASRHLRTIALGIREKGEALDHLLTTFQDVLAALYRLPKRLQLALGPFLERGERLVADTSAVPRGDGYRTYGYVWSGGLQGFQGLKAWMGELDTMLGIVGLPDICFPVYSNTELVLEEVYHPSLETRIPNTVSWTSRRHAILTGPNRGGKSTLCRAIGVSLLCAQSWGYAYAARMSFAPFDAIETALHPADTLGTMSLFEAEIEFAKSVLAKGQQSRTFVMMDEIFHSTNARDGLAASRVFLSQLYACPSVTSLISTHYKELPAEHAAASAWAMEAKEAQATNGCEELHYTYKKVDGISDKSSVMEILRERGLVR